MIMRYKIIIIYAALIVSPLFLTGCIEPNTVTYKVTFNATWSEETHPDDFPPNPHFSGLIGASHNDEVSFWKEGELASPSFQKDTSSTVGCVVLFLRKFSISTR